MVLGNSSYGLLTKWLLETYTFLLIYITVLYLRFQLKFPHLKATATD